MSDAVHRGHEREVIQEHGPRRTGRAHERHPAGAAIAKAPEQQTKARGIATVVIRQHPVAVPRTLGAGADREHERVVGEFGAVRRDHVASVALDAVDGPAVPMRIDIRCNSFEMQTAYALDGERLTAGHGAIHELRPGRDEGHIDVGAERAQPQQRFQRRDSAARDDHGLPTSSTGEWPVATHLATPLPHPTARRHGGVLAISDSLRRRASAFIDPALPHERALRHRLDGAVLDGTEALTARGSLDQGFLVSRASKSSSQPPWAEMSCPHCLRRCRRCMGPMAHPCAAATPRQALRTCMGSRRAAAARVGPWTGSRHRRRCGMVGSPAPVSAVTADRTHRGDSDGEQFQLHRSRPQVRRLVCEGAGDDGPWMTTRCRAAAWTRSSRQCVTRSCAATPPSRSSSRRSRRCCETLGPVVAKHPEFVRGKLMERIAEPERQIIFRVPWTDDRGEVHVERGFRVEFNSALGPYKGGLRFHPSVDLGDRQVPRVRAGLQERADRHAARRRQGRRGLRPEGPLGRRDHALLPVVHDRACGATSASTPTCPPGTSASGERELGYLFGQYKRITNRYESGVLTGKGLEWGGARVRREATGYGCAYFVEEMLAADGAWLRRSNGGRLRSRATSRSTRSRRRSSSAVESSRARTRPATSTTTQGSTCRCSSRSRSPSAARSRRTPNAATVAPGSCPDGERLGRPVRRRAAVRHAERADGHGRRAPHRQRRHRRRARAPTCRARPRPSGRFEPRAWPSPPARQRTPAAWRPARWRCSRTRRATPGPSTTPSSAYGRSCARSTATAVTPLRSTDCAGDYLAGANIAGFTRVARAMLALGLI